ncbi:MAG: polysaccharide biosynthesis/export family protein [Candidatus Omnitrophota bacterium]|jgi:polysaccharide export outer membrane protein
MRQLVLFLLTILFFAAPCGTSLAAQQGGGSPARAENYKIGIGDLLQVDVYDEPDLSVEVRVLTDGMISLPLIGSIRAWGLTVTALEQEVMKILGEKYLVNPQVTVIVKEFSRIFVFGEVREPSAFPLTGKLTVFEAITLAGGFTEVANKSAVKVIRQKPDGGETTFEVDIDRLTKKGDTSQDMELEANDRIVISRTFF